MWSWRMPKKTANPKSWQCLRWLTLPTRCLGEFLLSPGLETTNPIPNISVKKRLPFLCPRLEEQQCWPLMLSQFVSLDLLGLPISAVFEPSHFSSTSFRANFSLLVLQVYRFFPLKPFSCTVHTSFQYSSWSAIMCLTHNSPPLLGYWENCRENLEHTEHSPTFNHPVTVC